MCEAAGQGYAGARDAPSGDLTVLTRCSRAPVVELCGRMLLTAAARDSIRTSVPPTDAFYAHQEHLRDGEGNERSTRPPAVSRSHARYCCDRSRGLRDRGLA